MSPGLIGRLLEGSFEGKLTSSKWAKLAKCSQDTALRDIETLIELGIMEKEPGGGRSTAYRLLIGAVQNDLGYRRPALLSEHQYYPVSGTPVRGHGSADLALIKRWNEVVGGTGS